METALFDVAEIPRDPSPAKAPTCAWCHGPIPSDARSDAIYCEKRCRQAAHRFRRDHDASRTPADTTPARLAYADPPYPGKSGIYRDHPDYAGEVDHAELLERLAPYDGFALSTSAAAIQDVLDHATACGLRVKVAAWHRGERPTDAYGPLNAWEPVIYKPARAIPYTIDERRIDSLVHHARARLTDPNRVTGAKPAAFIWWMLDLIGAAPSDELDDLFPGSGGIARAWRIFVDGRPLPQREPRRRQRATGPHDASIQTELAHAD